MSEREEFLGWARSVLRDAEEALHNGDAAPRLAIWPETEPVTVLGALRSATGQAEVRELFGREGGDWKVAHRHADTVPDADS